MLPVIQGRYPTLDEVNRLSYAELDDYRRFLPEPGQFAINHGKPSRDEEKADRVVLGRIMELWRKLKG